MNTIKNYLFRKFGICFFKKYNKNDAVFNNETYLADFVVLYSNGDVCNCYWSDGYFYPENFHGNYEGFTYESLSCSKVQPLKYIRFKLD